MKNLAIILARKGSKRLKNKNFKILNGKPLIYWTIKFAKKTKIFEDIIVSTDSPEIKEFSNKEKVISPWLRPKRLSSDKVKSENAALHALNWYEKNYNKKISCVTLLQPTSPFRSIKAIKTAFFKFKKFKNKNVVSVSKEKKGNKNLFIIKKNLCIKAKNENFKNKYRINGNFYLISSKNLKNKKSFSSKNFVPLVTKTKKESLDIDTLSDFTLAQRLF
jgi:CMP-N,N'-diacetyllegionaminic acid synthase